MKKKLVFKNKEKLAPFGSFKPGMKTAGKPNVPSSIMKKYGAK